MSLLIKVSEAEGDQLDALVAQALGWKIVMWGDRAVWVQASGEGRFRSNVADWHPSTNPSQAWEIIECEGIKISPVYKTTCPGNFVGVDHWYSTHPKNYGGLIRYSDCGTTSLIAAMRCFVVAMLGKEVRVCNIFIYTGVG